MKKSCRRIGLYGCFLMMLSSCANPMNFGLDLHETAHFQKGGSGKFEIVFSLRRACKIIALGEYIAQEHIGFVKLLIAEAFSTTSKNLKQIPGISQIIFTHGPNMLQFNLSFQFRDIQALNKAMNMVYLNVDPRETVYFKTRNNIFVRKDTKAFTRLAHYYQSADDSLIKSFDIDFFFRNMRHIVQYSFAHKISQVSNPLASIALDGQSVTLIHYPFNKKEKDLSISNKIILD